MIEEITNTVSEEESGRYFENKTVKKGGGLDIKSRHCFHPHDLASTPQSGDTNVCSGEPARYCRIFGL